MAIQATSEEQLRMRRRARRRLLGAASLLLLAAIVLPMVLDKQPRPLDRDIEIRIPSQTAAPLASPPPVAAGAPSAQASASPPPVAADKTVAPPPAATVRQTEPIITQSEPPAESDAPHKLAVPTPAPAHKLGQDAGKVPEKPSPKAEAAHKSAETALENPVTPTHFVVQLGAFSNAENVRQLRDKLQAAGIHTYTEALPSGATRVRAGPFKTREQADRTEAGIALLGVQARVVGIDKP
ncbi:sporulation protein [Sulfuriferula plumbiphila]|uniref:Sporulation protein n=1 Tax=Sulfuriferula plumbiphila TaxID=171865 RepID=A0A512L6E5_9PROT|nr:SPOR domain-containing protein [Sulfuriferula plumbiphila]BBP03649.1 sporulation protein [Sulfuriferula plumbiphila]GEP30050.1 sporulation protein [Sulfuriferula plumbiphila]